MTDVRVGVVSWNTAELLDRCLSTLPAALDGLDAEVVVVDNGSKDNSVALASGHGGVRIDALDRNTGYARAMNRALAGTSADVLVALNSDTEPPAGSIRRLVEHLLAHPDTALVAPRLTYPDGSTQHSVYRFPSVRLAAAVNLLPERALRGRLGQRLWIEGTADHLSSGVVDWAIGAVHVMRASAVGPVPYSVRWFMYVEDLDLCWRLHRGGWQIELLSDVVVAHVGNASGAQQWGDERTAQWMAATYDWYASAHSPSAARAYASLNLVGALAKGAALRAVGRDSPARQRGRELLRGAPLHVSAVRHPDRVYVDGGTERAATVAAGSGADPS